MGLFIVDMGCSVPTCSSRRPQAPAPTRAPRTADRTTIAARSDRAERAPVIPHQGTAAASPSASRMPTVPPGKSASAARSSGSVSRRAARATWNADRASCAQKVRRHKPTPVRGPEERSPVKRQKTPASSIPTARAAPPNTRAACSSLRASARARPFASAGRVPKQHPRPPWGDPTCAFRRSCRSRDDDWKHRRAT